MQRPSLFLLIALAACGSDAPSPSEVRARIAKDLVTVVDSANASRAQGASLPDTAQLSLLSGALSHLSSRIPAATFGEMPSVDDDFDGTEAAMWLNEHLFTDANHAGDGVYNVPASLACTTDTGLDADCAQAFGKLQLRIRVSQDDDVLRLALQIGPHHDEPLEVGLSAKLLSLSVDLDETEDAIRALLPSLGGAEAPQFELAGKATAMLEVLAPSAVRVSLEFDRGIRIRVADAGESLDGPTAFDFSSRAAKVFALALDGSARSMQLDVALDQTHAKIPDELDGPTELDLPGFTASLTYTEGQPLVIGELGLPGPVRVTMNGAEAMRAELNPNDGRAFHGQLANGLLEVSPRVDFRTQVNHAVLGDEAPVYDVTRLLLEGGLRARADESVEVVGGTFSIETNPASYGFAAVTGQCVRGTEAYDTARDASYTQYSVGTCN